jgi:hypothetical protein
MICSNYQQRRFVQVFVQPKVGLLVSFCCIWKLETELLFPLVCEKSFYVGGKNTLRVLYEYSYLTCKVMYRTTV